MRFHEFGRKNNPLIILIHGVLTPWQIWEKQIAYFAERYFVIVPALDAHTEEEPSDYISAENEANHITEYILNNYTEDVFLLAGLSMGGVVANKIFESGKLRIKNLVLDGAPLVTVPRIMENIMKINYISIIHRAQNRDKKVLDNFEKYFLPPEFLPSFLKFSDTMSDESLSNIVTSACRCTIQKSGDKTTKILFLHGTKANEIVARQSAKKMRKAYADVTEKVFKGYAHGELLIYHPNEWCKVVNSMIT